jgi:hypothetical protein
MALILNDDPRPLTARAPMRLLFTIPHYYHPHAEGVEEAGSESRYGSHAPDPGPRIEALTACLTALHQLFHRRSCFIDHGRQEVRPIELPTVPALGHGLPTVPRALDVVICTTRDRHLLDGLPVQARYYTHRPTEAEPPLLGFECHTVLRERVGEYDYYGYLEDDLILHDPWLFYKLAWFNRHAGDDKLLQPNRYEAGLNYPVPKVYVDGDLAAHCTAPFQNVHDSEPLSGEVMGVRVEFCRTLNPHSGCFFLSAAQMEHWARQPHFFDRASRFIGPPETCATLGIMRTFKVYRPAWGNADFLEIQHFGAAYLKLLRRPGGSGSDGE